MLAYILFVRCMFGSVAFMSLNSAGLGCLYSVASLYNRFLGCLYSVVTVLR